MVVLLSSQSGLGLGLGLGWVAAAAVHGDGQKKKKRRKMKMKMKMGGELNRPDPPPPPPTLQTILKNKQRILESHINSMPPHQLETRLTSLPALPSPYPLLQAVVDRSLKKDVTVIVEAARVSPSESPESLATRCRNYIQWGANAIAIRTDEETSPDGVADLVAVCKTLNVPVVRSDWILHPLQVAETREAGAAALTTVYTILKKGLPALSNYALSLGLDTIVEVINLRELEAVLDFGITLYGINLSVGLSLSLPGFREDVAKSLLGQMPFGAYTIVGVNSQKEAVEMKIAGADAIYLRYEVIRGLSSNDSAGQDEEAFLKSICEVLAND